MLKLRGETGLLEEVSILPYECVTQLVKNENEVLLGVANPNYCKRGKTN